MRATLKLGIARIVQNITSSYNPKFRAAIQLHTSRGRRKQNRIVIFGWRETERAIANAVEIAELFVCPALVEPTAFSHLRRCAIDHGKEIYSVPEELFEKLKYGERSDGVVATAFRPASRLEDFSVTSSSFYLVVQGIEKIIQLHAGNTEHGIDAVCSERFDDRGAACHPCHFGLPVKILSDILMCFDGVRNWRVRLGKEN